MPGRMLLDEELLKDKFGFETNNPDSEVTSEKRVVTNADGSSVETIIKNANNTPSKRAIEDVANPDKVRMTDGNSTTLIDPTQAGDLSAKGFSLFEESDLGGFNSPRAAAHAERQAANAERLQREQMIEAGIIEKPEVSAFDKPEGWIAPRGQMLEEDKSAAAEAKLEEDASLIAQAVQGGYISEEEGFAQLDAIGYSPEGETDESAIETGGSPFDNPLVEEGMTAPEIMEQESLAKQAAEADVNVGAEIDTLTTDVPEEDREEVAEGWLANMSKMYSDNPAMWDGIIAAAANFIATGNPYQAISQGIAGGFGSFKAGQANKIATLTAEKEAFAASAEQRLKLKKEGYTSASIAAYQASESKDDSLLVNSAPTKPVISGKPSGTKYIDGQKIDFWQAEDGNTYFKGPKGETLQAAPSFAGREDYDAKFHSQAARVDRADAWSKQLSTEIADEIPSTEEYMPGVNSGRILQGMNTYAKKYGKDIGNFSIADRTAIKRAAEDMVAENKLRADRGLPLEKNFNKYIEAAIIRSDGLDAGVPVGAFITSGTEDVNEAAMSEAYSVIRNGTKVDGRTETELWAIAATQYEALGQKKIKGMEEDGADHKMSGFLYFLTNLDFSKS